MVKKHNEQYDSYYDDEKDEWLEGRCPDINNCEFCKDRPIKPSAAKP